METAKQKSGLERVLQVAKDRYCPWTVVNYASYLNDAPLTPSRYPFLADGKGPAMFGAGDPIETRPANPMRQLEWTTPVREQLKKIERRLESLDFQATRGRESQRTMSELAQAV